jgi:hypothetical protein
MRRAFVRLLGITPRRYRELTVHPIGGRDETGKRSPLLVRRGGRDIKKTTRSLL